MLKRVLVATIVVVASIAAGSAHAATTPMIFADPAGDNGTAPDITTVTVNNDAQSQYTFTVALATDYATNAEFYLYLDTDKNAATGDTAQDGADYLIYDDHATHSADLYKWDSTQWSVAPETTMRLSVASDLRSLTITVNASDLSASKAFNFFVASTDGDGSNGHFDDAPSGSGTFAYALQQAVTLSLSASKTVLSRSQHSWTIAMGAVRSDTGELVGSEGTITCTGKAGSAKLKTRLAAFVSAGAGKGSAGVCAFVLPKKHVKVTAIVTISYAGSTVSKTFTAKS